MESSRAKRKQRDADIIQEHMIRHEFQESGKVYMDAAVNADLACLLRIIDELRAEVDELEGVK